MRTYLQSEQLAKAVKMALERIGKTQKVAAKELKTTQGALSNLLAGRFDTKNSLVLRVCKYVSIDPDDFRICPVKIDKVDPEALAALTRACGGQKRKTEAVIRVLRALETLAPR